MNSSSINNLQINYMQIMKQLLSMLQLKMQLATMVY